MCTRGKLIFKDVSHYTRMTMFLRDKNFWDLSQFIGFIPYVNA